MVKAMEYQSDMCYFPSKLLEDIWANRRDKWQGQMVRWWRKSYGAPLKSCVCMAHLNVGKHWILVVLDFPSKTIYTVDSIGCTSSHHGEKVATNMPTYLQDRESQLGTSSRHQPSTINQEWQCKAVPCTTQMDGNSCGVHVIQVKNVILLLVIYCVDAEPRT